ncbi:hypothetical protein KAU43_03640 [candidate division WOR-3 bacterium]|nr:hypothetical protein [candidate division WOR-3 bacterium]
MDKKDEKKSSGIDIEKLPEGKIMNVRATALGKYRDELDQEINELELNIESTIADLTISRKEQSKKPLPEIIEGKNDYQRLKVRIIALQKHLDTSQERFEELQEKRSLVQSDLEQTWEKIDYPHGRG